MSHDPLTDIVRSLDLTGALFLNAELTAPWALSARLTEDNGLSCPTFSKQIIAYYMVIEGALCISLADASGRQQDYRAQAGDILLITHKQPYVLASASAALTGPGPTLTIPMPQEGLAQLTHGGGGERTRILAGFMTTEANANPLLDALPPVLVVPIEDPQTRTWIEASVMMAARQISLGTHHAKSTVSGICELFLTEAVRAYLEGTGCPDGWLMGIANPHMARVLSKIHGSLSKPPSVSDLARLVGMSRSIFVERFSKVMGTGPKRYMLKQRMDLAEALLRETELTSAQIAVRVGYDAPEAFSRAFKREHGLAPAVWRREVSRYDVPPRWAPDCNGLAN